VVEATVVWDPDDEPIAAARQKDSVSVSQKLLRVVLA
jgi:hypothetical protein